MTRAWVVALVWTLTLGSVLSSEAETPPVSVKFGGEMRLIGYSWNNVQDFTDTDRGTFKDNDSRYFQRFRLFTTIESADRKARAYWALEIGDITWGAGGGSSGTEYGGGGGGASVGKGGGGEVGADGVNVETKNLYVQFDVPGLPGVSLVVGAHNVGFLSGPAGAFLDDDALGIQVTWKTDRFDVQLDAVKLTENARANADDNDLYVARLGVNLTKDTRVTVEGLLIDAQCFARQLAPGALTVAPGPAPGAPAVTGPAAAPTRTGACVGADLGDNVWVGATVGTTILGLTLHGTVVYGRRALFSDTLGRNIEEQGFGYQVTAQRPIGVVQATLHHWYTTGDESRIVGLAPSGSRAPGPGQDFAPVSFTTRLNRDSDKLPVPVSGTSWVGAPFVAEAFFGHRTLGTPDLGQPHYANPTGTWGVGAAGVLPVAPTLALGAGVAFVAATESNGIFGDHFVEIDAGVLYTYNANLSFQGLATYAIPDAGADAWSLGFRSRFGF